MEYKMIMSQDGTKLVNIHYIQSIVIDDNLGFCTLVAVMEKRGNEIELAKYDSSSDAKMVFDELAAFFADEYSQFARNTVFAMPGQLTVNEMNSSVRKSYKKVCKSSKNIADNVFKDDADSLATDKSASLQHKDTEISVLGTTGSGRDFIARVMSLNVK